MLGEELGEAIGYFAARLQGRVAGLTDEEYLWEPVARCWSVRPGPAGGWAPDLGPAGTLWTDVSPPPFTTIAWRMWHLGASPAAPWPPTTAPTPRAFADAWFGGWPQEPATGYGTAADAIAALDKHWRAFGERVATYDDEGLLERIGDIGGPYSTSSIHGLVIHVVDELIHHSAEIGVLRDL